MVGALSLCSTDYLLNLGCLQDIYFMECVKKFNLCNRITFISSVEEEGFMAVAVAVEVEVEGEVGLEDQHLDNKMIVSTTSHPM